MRVLVVSNCVTGTFVQTIRAIFPAWDVRGAGVQEAADWLQDNSKPAFTDYAAHCDLYLGWDPAGHPIDLTLNPRADRIVIPSIHFRGLHPDIASVPGLWGPFSTSHNNDQVSLIMVAAKYLGYSADQTLSLFRPQVFDALGYGGYYDTERTRFIQNFLNAGHDIEMDVRRWEKGHDFFYVPHHPRVFVLFDIIVRALSGTYLHPGQRETAQALRTQQPDNLDWAEIWPVYPALAQRVGSAGSMTWFLPSQAERRERSLPEMVTLTFAALDNHAGDWKDLAFIREAGMIIAGLPT